MWLASRSGRFSPGEIDPCTHWLGGGVRLRTRLDNMLLPGLKICPLLTKSLLRNAWTMLKGWTTERGQSSLHCALTDSGPLILLINMHWGLVSGGKAVWVWGWIASNAFWDGVLFSLMLSRILDCLVSKDARILECRADVLQDVETSMTRKVFELMNPV
jgi:hypothetical protein